MILKQKVSGLLDKKSKPIFEGQEFYVEEINAFNLDKESSDLVKVFKYSGKENIQKYLKQLGAIAFIHLLLGNKDGILGNFNLDKFIMDENENLKSIYTNISLIDINLMIRKEILDIDESEKYIKSNSNKLLIDNLDKNKADLFKELKNLINKSIKQFWTKGEISFVEKFINVKSGFLFIMGDALRDKDFNNKEIINEISAGFIFGMLSVFNNFKEETMLIDDKKKADINNREFNIIKEVFIQAKKIIEKQQGLVKTISGRLYNNRREI